MSSNPLSERDIQVIVQETIRSLQGGNSIFKEFLQLQPPEFDGSLRQEDVAKEFVSDLENIYQVLNCTTEMKVKLATFRLKGQTREWWHDIHKELVDQMVPWTWDQFVEEFYSKYRPEWMYGQWEDAFINLQQGGMTVPEYQYRFEKLSRYCQRLIDTEYHKIRKFVRGDADYSTGLNYPDHQLLCSGT